LIVIIIRFTTIFACSYGGYRVADLLNRRYVDGHVLSVAVLATGTVLGFLVGYVLGGVLGRKAADLLGRLESLVFRVSGATVFFGALGLIGGFIIALLPSIALFRFGVPGYIISLFLFFISGYICMRVGIVKRSELSAMFNLGPGLGGYTTGGQTGRLLDTSVIIDGRIVDITKAGFLDGTMIVPRFILHELQTIADSPDTLKRNRGRRGLDTLNALQKIDNVRVEITDQDFPELTDVDSKLIALSKLTGMVLMTNDYNLNRIAEIQGVKILNINELANAVKPVILPGETFTVKIIREGKEPGQGVGYLDDGTMVVIQEGKDRVGEEVKVVATSILQTPAGKMIFTDIADDSAED